MVLCDVHSCRLCDLRIIKDEGVVERAVVSSQSPDRFAVQFHKNLSTCRNIDQHALHGSRISAATIKCWKSSRRSLELLLGGQRVVYESRTEARKRRS